MLIRLNKKYLFICFVIISCSACNRSIKETENFLSASTITFDIENAVIPIDSLIDFRSFDFVSLQTDNQSAIGIVKKLIKADKDWLIWEANNNIKLFANNGTYIRNIGNKGKGPCEYTGIADLHYNYLSHEIELVDNNNKWLCYNLNGMCLLENSDRIRKFGVWLFYPDKKKKNAYMFYSSFLPLDTKENVVYRFYRTENDQIVYKALPFNAQLQDISFVSNSQFYESNDSIRFFMPAFPIVYDVLNTELRPRYFFQLEKGISKRDYSKYIGKEETYLSNYRGPKLFLSNIIEDEKYLFANCVVDSFRNWCIYDKNTGKALLSSMPYLLLTLDLELKEFYLIDNRLYSVLYAEDVLKMQEYLKKHGRYTDKTIGDLANSVLKLNVKWDSNPVLISFKLK